MMNNVIVYKKIPEHLLDHLKKYCNVTYFEEINEKNRNEFYEQLKTTNGLLGSAMKITTEILDRAPLLRVVSNTSAGYDNLNLDDLTKRGIMATNAPDALTDTVADLIFGLLLATARRITELDRYIRNGEWTANITKERFGQDVHHQTLGIIGMGRIGKAVAKRAAFGFDMKVLYNKRNRDMKAEEQLGVTYCELTDLLAESDFVCLTLPLSSDTHHLIGKAELKKMKSSGIIINGARGAVINQHALIHALKDGEILGAGLDVFEEEPLPYQNELLSMENVVLLPHIGSATENTREKMVEHGIENLLQGLNGAKASNMLNDRKIKGN